MALTPRQRENVSKYLFDVSKFTFVGLVLGKFIATVHIANWVFIGGAVFTILAFLVATFLDKGERT